MERVCQEAHEPVPAVNGLDLRWLIDAMLSKNPDDRPSADEIVERVRQLLPNEDLTRVDRLIQENSSTEIT